MGWIRSYISCFVNDIMFMSDHSSNYFVSVLVPASTSVPFFSGPIVRSPRFAATAAERATSPRTAPRRPRPAWSRWIFPYFNIWRNGIGFLYKTWRLCDKILALRLDSFFKDGWALAGITSINLGTSNSDVNWPGSKNYFGDDFLLALIFLIFLKCAAYI